MSRATDPLTAEFQDFLPVYGMVPELSEADVERFAALGREGWERLRSGDEEGAEAAFRAQLGIFAANPEPFVSLALLEASRGAKKAAVEHVRSAVVRGFVDLRRIERAELWTPLRGSGTLYGFQDAVRALADVERKWADWSSFEARSTPDDLETVLRDHAQTVERIDRMSPALGPRYARLLKRLSERVTGSLLEAYVTDKPEAPDRGYALEKLMRFYTGGPLGQWDLLAADAASRLAEVSNVLLERFPESSGRPYALVGLGLARNTDRNRRGVLRDEAAEKIRACLGEVLTDHSDSAVVTTAVVGLVRTELNVGRPDRASAHYREFRESHSADLLLLAQVREELGELALRLGGLPEFRATALDGQTVDETTLRGKVAVVDFWATWCRPCVEGFPTLQRIKDQHGDDVVLLGVNLDSADDMGVEELRSWVARQEVPGSHLHDGLSWDSEILKAFGVKEIPFNVVVDPEGAVLAVNEHGKRLEKAVNAALRDE